MLGIFPLLISLRRNLSIELVHEKIVSISFINGKIPEIRKKPNIQPFTNFNP